MATTTTNYGLTKPSYGDNADIAVINSNMDKIDAKMKEIEDAGGGGASTWAGVANKPFETVGSGLNVDESGALNVTGGGSGGSSVSWNQIQTSGSKIAEVTIDGTKTDVYAPTGGSGGGTGGNVYSTDETVIGTWIDGRPIYRKVFVTNSNDIDVTDLNIDVPIRFDAYGTYDGGYKLLVTTGSAATSVREMYFQNNHVKLGVSSFSTQHVVIEYVKVE